MSRLEMLELLVAQGLNQAVADALASEDPAAVAAALDQLLAFVADLVQQAAPEQKLKDSGAGAPAQFAERFAEDRREIAKVRKFAEDHKAALAKCGSTPDKFVGTFVKARQHNPNFRAADLIGK